ncbi:MAG: YHS domain-containing protein [Candidatus Methanoperedens sp.]|nr:YHS domain-containing protein [Candidatus Methanoperedens sp.]
MPIDPVCWMHVERNSECTAEYNGQKYYFCSLKCKERLNKEQRQTIIMVTHNPELGAMADRIIYFRDGVVMEE